MNEAIDKAIKYLTERTNTASIDAHHVMQLTQAVLNLAHAKSILAGNKGL